MRFAESEKKKKKQLIPRLNPRDRLRDCIITDLISDKAPVFMIPFSLQG